MKTLDAYVWSRWSAPCILSSHMCIDVSRKLQVFLLTTKAGSLGINLTTARRMLILDEPWNPVHNAQVGTCASPWNTRSSSALPWRLVYTLCMQSSVYRSHVNELSYFWHVVWFQQPEQVPHVPAYQKFLDLQCQRTIPLHAGA